MQFRLRTLLIVLAVGPMVLAGVIHVATEMRRPRLKGCFGDDLGPVRPIRILDEDEAKLGIHIEQ